MVSSLSISFPFIGTIFDFSTTALPSSTAMAIDYAVNHGAHVINMSYGISGLGYTLAVVTQQLSVLYDAISNAYDNNVVLVAAMGNEYQQGNPIEYPAGFYEVIGVGQTNNSLERVETSNTGPNIDVSAPGSYYTTSRNNSYAYLGGTSSATPVVSGVAGLIISQGMDRGFNLTNDDVKHILEITADDIESYGLGWDEETGYGKVNAYNALQLLDEPNALYHYTSTGGTSVKLQTLDQWILIDGRWELAPGMYLSVDQYKITKHVVFDVPFCSIPQVWMRERQSKSLSYGNPNGGQPFCIITNVSNTGFDLEYVTYYVRYNLAGQTLNKWFPAAPASTYVAYTAVGEPNLAATAGPITGPSGVCSSGTAFTIENLPPVSSIIWTCGPYLTVTSGQNTSTCTFSATSTSSSSTWVRATLVTDCGNIILPQKTVYAALSLPPLFDVSGPGSIVLNSTEHYVADILPMDISSYGIYYYDWSVTSNFQFASSHTGQIDVYVKGIALGRGTISFYTTNGCGSSAFNFPVRVVSGLLRVYPNPANNEITLGIDYGDRKYKEYAERDLFSANEYVVTIYNPSGTPVFVNRYNYKEIKINVSGWQRGIYYVNLKTGEEEYSTTFVVE